MDGLKKALETVLQEIQDELDNLSECEEDESVLEHKQMLNEKQQQIKSLLEATTEAADEIELREEVTAEDDLLVRERQSGRRTAHRPTWQDTASIGAQPRTNQIVKERITERSVDPNRVLQKDYQMQHQMMLMDVERLSKARSVQDENGIVPPGKGVSRGDI